MNENASEMRSMKMWITVEAIQLLETGDGFAKANKELLFDNILTIVQREQASSKLTWSYSQLRNWIISFSHKSIIV